MKTLTSGFVLAITVLLFADTVSAQHKHFGSSFGSESSTKKSTFGSGSLLSEPKRNDGFGTTMNPHDFRNDKGTVIGTTHINSSGSTAHTTYFHPGGGISTEISHKSALGTSWTTSHFNTDGTISTSITHPSMLGLSNHTVHFNGDGTLGTSTMHLNMLGTGSNETHFGPDGLSSSSTRTNGLGSSTTTSQLPALQK